MRTRCWDVCFPAFVPELAETAHRYYRTHFEFVRRLLEYNGCPIRFYVPEVTGRSDRTRFDVWLDNAHVIFDVSDYQHPIGPDLAGAYDAVFKFHFKASDQQAANVFPFSPISFYDWTTYARLKEEIRYSARGLVLNNQTPHTQNYARRVFVRQLLAEALGERADLSVSDQLTFWRKINGALVSVCVPGARIDILDRGQLQYMAFGAATISPRLSIDLPYGEQLQPGVHYLECRPDWSDLLQVIAFAEANPGECLRIGRNAQALFERTLSAKAVFDWMQLCLERVSRRTANPVTCECA